MPADVLFVHSAGPQSGEQGSAPFVNALRRSLGPDYQVAFPAMPAPTQPSYERWKEALDQRFAGGASPSFLVGHSLGGSVLLKYLSEQSWAMPALGLFVVAAPFWRRGGSVEEFVLRDGFAHSLPEALRIYLYQSRDDEELGSEHLSAYAAALPQATVRQPRSGGHTFARGLPELVEDLRALSASSARKDAR
jgi:predicted alpha/beta hydrolase family esterase